MGLWHACVDKSPPGNGHGPGVGSSGGVCLSEKIVHGGLRKPPLPLGYAGSSVLHALLIVLTHTPLCPTKRRSFKYGTPPPLSWDVQKRIEKCPRNYAPSGRRSGAAVLKLINVIINNVIM